MATTLNAPSLGVVQPVVESTPVVVATPARLAPTPLLPDGFLVPASRWTRPSTRMRELMRTEPYLFGPGVYDPMGATARLGRRFVEALSEDKVV